MLGSLGRKPGPGSSRAREIDVLWLVEHVAREFDVACVAKVLLERDFGLRAEIRNVYRDIREYLVEFHPRVVVHPFVYFVKGAMGTEEIFERWPDAIHVNAAWEQIHYRAHENIKAPADELARNGVVHRAWGNFYADYLRRHGVRDENIVVSGHPAYALYHSPYREFFRSREALAAAYGLDVRKRWLFVPENYRWAFARGKIDFFVGIGGDRDELVELVEFSIPSLKQLLIGCLGASRLDGVEVVFRPRPANSTERIRSFFREHVGEDFGAIHVIKEGSVREWIVASDLVVSSYSTSLIEAAIASRPAYMFEPIPMPAGLYCNWYDFAPRIRSADELVSLCAARELEPPCAALVSWATENLLPVADPIRRCVEDLAELCSVGGPRPAPGGLSSQLSTRKYFNEETHEMDALSADEVQRLVQRWADHLAPEGTQPGDTMTSSTMTPLHKTMDRDDLLSTEGQQLVGELNDLIERIYSAGVAPSSWVGTIPKAAPEGGRGLLRRVLDALKPGAAGGRYKVDPSEARALDRGVEQRWQYRALDVAADDLRYPWFLYWEIFWVLRYMRPLLRPGMSLLDAGGASSLFTCYMAARQYELHSVDLNKKLLANGDRVAEKMGWKSMHSYCMDMRKLDFPDDKFDHAFSICVFEHLDYDVKQAALREISRCMKPGGILSLTFDYRNPAPGVVGIGKDPSARNALKSEADIQRSFLQTGLFEVVQPEAFVDNGKSYLSHPMFEGGLYTFGSIFLKNCK